MLRCGRALIGIWGVGISLLGIINVNDGPLPTSGAVHDTIATAAFGAAVAAIACVSFVYASNKLWPVATAVSWSAVGLALAALAFTFEDASWFGLVERALGLTIVGWLVVATSKPVVRILRGDAPETGPLDMAPPAPAPDVGRLPGPPEPEPAGAERYAA